MTKESFLSFYKGTPWAKAAGVCFDAVDAALTKVGINTPMTLIASLATCRTEVGKAFLPIREKSSGIQYEGRKDLGNTQKGDGPKYRGAGIIQLTGRANYAYYGKKIGVDLINHPELALDMKNATLILAWYFKDRGVNVACDAKDWIKVRKLVNGGTNGLDTFLSVIKQYLSA